MRELVQLAPSDAQKLARFQDAAAMLDKFNLSAYPARSATDAVSTGSVKHAALPDAGDEISGLLKGLCGQAAVNMILRIADALVEIAIRACRKAPS